MTSVLLTVRVKPDVASRLEKLAESMERPKTYLAAQAIEDYLSIQEWHDQAVQEGIAAADRGELIDFEEFKKQWKDEQ